MRVLLVTIDAWRASFASFLPAVSESHTPFLETLAADGVAFSQAVSHGPATPYAFPALLSSTYPLDYGGYERIATDRTLVSEALAAAGYRCVGVHANPWLGEQYGYGRGYAQYRDVGEFGLPLLDRGRALLVDRFGLDHPVYRAAQSVYRAVQSPLRRLGGGADPEVTAGLEAIRTATRDAFVWVHLLAPHAPYAPPARFRDAAGVPAFDGSAVAFVTRAQRAPASLSLHERDVVVRLYAAAIRHADAQVRRLVEAVDEETLVVVTADHGEALFEHGQVGHDPCLYDELVHVPLLVRPPASTACEPSVVDRQVQHLDVAPTILDYAGVDPPASYRGQSLRPAIEGGAVEDRLALSEVASTRAHPGRIDAAAIQVGVRRPDRKLVSGPDGRVRGFDLVADPGETDPIVDPTGGPWAALRDRLHDRLDDLALGAADHVERDESVDRRLRDLGYLE